MHLDEPAAGVEAQAEAILARRLLPQSPRPLAIALSGGGDSLALAIATAAWARRHERRLLFLTVDHGLQPESQVWTARCEAIAHRLGGDFQPLLWTGDKPSTGLPAAARAARHALLAEAARAAGARVLLMGHTADDILEARAMRGAGATTPDPRGWTPSPAWPEGRNLMLLRPLLGVRRAAIRTWLRSRGETWIDDPANDDQRYGRARARAGLGDAPLAVPPEPPPDQTLATAYEVGLGGTVSLARAPFGGASEEARRWFLGRAVVCAGGGAGRPAAERLQRLADRLTAPGPVVATLAGARILADASTVLITREPGEARRGGLAPTPLRPGETTVWDGRFEIVADRPGLEVRGLAGLAGRLPASQRAVLRRLPPATRGALPVIVREDTATCPLLTPGVGVRITPLVADRLAAACGLTEREPI